MQLSTYQHQNPLIMAIPRGGVVLGRILADELKGSLDVVLVRKIGAPDNPEFAIGAISESGQFWPNRDAPHYQYLQKHIEHEIKQQLAIIQKRRRTYQLVPKAIKGKTVILVDDGIATGATITAAIREIRSQHPKQLIAAIPVAPADVLPNIHLLVDEVVCLHQPEDFYAVGQFYGDFPQVTDTEVIQLFEK